jgi:glyoxylase-like metal-dependent hydrolase (beta-lactamase superfamily II)
MQLRVIPVTMFQSNCVVAWDETTGEGVLFDTGGDAGKILDFVQSKGIAVKGIFLTHGHVDHVAGTNRVKSALSAPVYLHPLDKELADATSRQCLMFGIPMEEAPQVDHDLAEGDRFTIGSMEFSALHLPGHSPGCTAFLFSGPKPVLVCGDVLFESSIGRTDLPGGDMAKMQESLQRLKQLPEDVVVVPGHGRQTSIGREKKTNPYLSDGFRMW